MFVPNANAFVYHKVLTRLDCTVTDSIVNDVFWCNQRMVILSRCTSTYGVCYCRPSTLVVSDYQIICGGIARCDVWIRSVVNVVQMNINSRVSNVFECLSHA